MKKTHEKTFRPTSAGLLMFGYDIERIFPNYFLDYQEKLVMTYVEDKGSCIRQEIEDLLHIKGTRARVILSQMVKKDLLIARGANRNRTYICNHNL